MVASSTPLQRGTRVTHAACLMPHRRGGVSPMAA
ncbi:hypothetical protein LEMLEM_LOCUS5223 [Lemmus lemmus]